MRSWRPAQAAWRREPGPQGSRASSAPARLRKARICGRVRTSGDAMGPTLLPGGRGLPRRRGETRHAVDERLWVLEVREVVSDRPCLEHRVRDLARVTGSSVRGEVESRGMLPRGDAERLWREALGALVRGFAIPA